MASRLAQGRSAVDTLAEYVWASALLGYQHADLTRNPGDVHDWYTTEEGLDLQALDTDWAALTSVHSSVEQAARRQDHQVRVLPEAWQGNGAQASREFLVRHAATSEQAVVALRSAADALAELRDSLWRAVDRKVEDAIEIEGRRAPERAVWLAAARTVRTGLGDRDTASELVDQQVKPFVANDIAGDWLTAMRAGTTAVVAAYDRALAALRSAPIAVFSVPGQLGPARTPAGDHRSSTPAAAVTPAGQSVPMPYPPPSTAPAFSPATQAIPSTAAPTVPAAAPVDSAGWPSSPPASPAPLGAPEPVSPSLGAPSLGGGFPDLGSGLSGVGPSGLGQRLADMFGGLIGSAGDAAPADLGDPLGDPDRKPEDAAGDEDAAEDAAEDEQERFDGESDDVAEDEASPETDDAADDKTDAEPDAEPVEDEAIQPAPEPTLPPSPVDLAEPVDPAEPAAEPLTAPVEPARTPCEIAADELPQVGG